jgi:hypothetical protein
MSAILEKHNLFQKHPQKTPSASPPPRSVVPATSGVSPKVKSPSPEPEFVRMLRELKDKMGGLRKRTRKELNKQLMQIYAVADVLRKDEDAWIDFCEMPEWKDQERLKLTPGKRNDALRYVLRYAVGFESRRATDRVSKYYGALNPSFVARTPAEEIPDVITKGGGLEALRQANARRRSDDAPAKPSKTVALRVLRSDLSEKLMAKVQHGPILVKIKSAGTKKGALFPLEILSVKRKK